MRQILHRSAVSIIALTAPLAVWAGPEAMTHEEARHLMSRTGFGAAPSEIAAMTGLSYKEGVAQILAGIQNKPTNPMPAWVDAWAYPHDQIWSLGNTATDLYFTNRWQEVEQLQRWWLKEMVETPSPLTEKLTLFWHDHFATGYDAHERPQWTAQQNRLLRRHAAGNFADLAAGILKDPSMLVYLTNTENSAEAPNENLAREFLELFTLGEGRGYSETDVVEAARALTAHTVNDFADGSYVFDPEEHDAGEKTILGISGHHTADNLPQIVMSNAAFGPFIVEKLWRAFVSHDPDPVKVARLTEVWRAANWELKPLLQAMFLTDAFWDTTNRGTLVKSPVDLMVGSVRTLGVTLPELNGINWAVGDLGQSLFFPPNVGGWPEGTEWMNDATASGRATMLTYFMHYDQDPAEEVTPMMTTMMQAADSAPPVIAGPDDLSVGQIFLLGSESWEQDQHHVKLTLFDVGFGGHRWRSVSFFIDAFSENDFEIVMQVSDCAPECFADWPHKDDNVFGWIWIEAKAIANDELDWMSDDDRALLAALMGHMPELLAATKDQRAFQPTADSEGQLPYNDAQTAATWIADFGADTLGIPSGSLVLATTPPATVGLRGMEFASRSEEEFEAYMEAQEITSMQDATPPVAYPTAEAWLQALPMDGFDSLRAEASLLAIPLPGEGRRMERDASDPNALIRHIILSPYYQLN